MCRWHFRLVTAAAVLIFIFDGLPRVRAETSSGTEPDVSSSSSGAQLLCPSLLPADGADCGDAGCVSDLHLCDGRDDCGTRGSGGDAADERHCGVVIASYQPVLATTLSGARAVHVQVGRQTCAALCFLRDWCTMFSYSLTGGKKCQLGCQECESPALVATQTNSILYNVTTQTSGLRLRLREDVHQPADAAQEASKKNASGGTAQLAAIPETLSKNGTQNFTQSAMSSVQPASNSSEGPNVSTKSDLASPLPAPGVCGLRHVAGPLTQEFEMDLLTVSSNLSAENLNVSSEDQPDSGLRVVGVPEGQTAAYGEFPWMAQLQVLRSGTERQRHICGASIVTDRLLITAAHCLTHPQHLYQVKVGQFDTQSADAEEQTFALQQVIRHPDYGAGSVNDSIYLNDIAVLQLRLRAGAGIRFSDRVQPLCVSRSAPSPPQLCVVSGWGLTGDGDGLPAELAGATVPLVSDALCGSSDVYGARYSAEKQLCAGELLGGADACQGDSGGPLACFDGHWYLAGVVSHGDGCGRPLRPGVYTRAAAYYDWIATTVRYLNSV